MSELDPTFPDEEEYFIDWMAFYKGEPGVIVRRPLVVSPSLLELVEEGTLSREAYIAMLDIYGQ